VGAADRGGCGWLAINLQETLSAHLDTVEARLLAKISRRSDDFFVAMAQLQR
jgi:hypothetical protein